MTKSKYDEGKVRKILEYCGYETGEAMDRDTRRLIEVMPRALITPEEVSDAIPKMEKLYGPDLELKSLRMTLGIWMRKFLALMYCKDDYRKAAYQLHPGEPRHCLMVNLADKNVYCDFADSVFFFIQSQIFGNINKYLEIGERSGLPPARAHCGINVLLAGLFADDIIPKPDVLICTDYQCDQTHKLTEMLSELYKVPIIKMDTISDEPWGEFPSLSERAVRYFGKTWTRMIEQTEKALDITISEDVIQLIRHNFAKLWRLLHEINVLYVEADPRPARFDTIGPLSMMLLETDRIVYNEAGAVMEQHIKEIKERMARGFGVIEKGAPKVVLKCGLGGDAYSIGSVLEDSGVNPIVFLNALWLAPFEFAPMPEYVKKGTLGEKVAASYLRKGYIRAGDHHNYRIKEIVKQTKADGMLMSYAYQCRAFAGLPFMVKDTVEKECGVPCMPLEVGAFDARDYAYGALKTRIETFGDLLRARKAAKEEAAASSS